MKFLPPRCWVDSIGHKVATEHVRCESRTSNVYNTRRMRSRLLQGILSPCPHVTNADGYYYQQANGDIVLRPFNKPQHQWDGTALQFENPDGTWGDSKEANTRGKSHQLQPSLS